MGKMESRQTHNVWSVPLQPAKQFQLLSEALSDRTVSFSEKARLREALKTKKMEAAKAQFVYLQSKDLPGTPSPMVATPRELYGPAGSRRGLLPSVAVQPRSNSSLMSASKKRANHFSPPVAPNVQRRTLLKRNRAVPHDVANKRPVYLPGPIQLEERTLVTPKRGSIATMKPLDPGSESKAKQCSDVVAMDGVVMFFEELGMGERATKGCLDRYWIEKRTSRQFTTPREAAPPAPPVPPRPPIPPVPSSSSSFVGPKRALQQEDRSPAASPITPGRQKGRLRQLLKASRTKL